MKQRWILTMAALALLVGGLARGVQTGSDGDPASSVLAATRAADGRPPVVMVVFDEFPVASLLNARGRIDAGRFPNFAELARRSTWFRNTAAIHDRTTYAVPAILTGRYPRKAAWQDYCFHRQNLFTLLHRRGYAVHAVEPSTALWPPYSCRPVHRKKHARALLSNGRRPSIFRRWVASIRASRRPAVWFQHTMLPHMPWQYLPSGRTFGNKPRRRGPPWTPGLNTPAGFHDRYLVRLAYQRHLLQVGYVDRLLGRLLRRLRATGLYDRSLIVITADHGIGFHLNHDRRFVDRSNIADIAPVPLFMKLPGQRGGRVVRRHLEAIDVLPTIAHVLRLRPRRRFHGRSGLRRRGRGRRSVTVFQRTWRVLRMPIGRMDRREATAIRHKERLFGSGDWSSVHRYWGHRELIGRPVAALAAASSSRVRARFAGTRWLRSVNPGSGMIPSLINGTVRGGSGRAEREVALAVNGRVVATGKTFRLRGNRRERFALLVPEESLRPGANRVELLWLRPGRRARPVTLGRLR